MKFFTDAEFFHLGAYISFGSIDQASFDGHSLTTSISAAVVGVNTYLNKDGGNIGGGVSFGLRSLTLFGVSQSIDHTITTDSTNDSLVTEPEISRGRSR